MWGFRHQGSRFMVWGLGFRVKLRVEAPHVSSGSLEGTV